MTSLRALRPALLRCETLARQPFHLPLPRVPVPTCRRHYSDEAADKLRPIGPVSQPTKAWSRISPTGLEISPLPGVGRMGTRAPRNILDNCRCAQCVNQDTMQRNLGTFSIPQDIHILSGEENSTHVYLKWSDGHSSSYPWSFFHRKKFRSFSFQEELPRDFWGAEVKENPPSVSYGEVMGSESGLAQLTTNIRKRGFSFVTDTPHDDPNDTKTLLERIAFIRQTHYGGFYDFKPDLAMADTAYTNVALPAHTDTTYFTEPAGLQAFHLLSHEPAPGEEGASGGESLLVDGFHAASLLKKQDAGAYRILARVGIPWHASGNEGITIAPDKVYPVFEHYDGHLHRIRWNNADRGVVPFHSIPVTRWYRAAQKWDQLLKSEELQYWFQLKPGTVVIFDNWRVLHGRSSFKGIRRMCGGYINRDDFISRWRNTNLGREEARERVMCSEFR